MTGNFSNWDGNLLDIGPIDPFVGSELVMVLILVVLWVVWHVLQIRMENDKMETEARALRQGESLSRVLQEEHTIERM
jgi:hypothetical protein